MIMMKSNVASAARQAITRTSIVHANRPAIAYFSSNNHKLQKLPIDYLGEARKKMDTAEASHQSVTSRTVHNGIGRRKLQKLPIDYINEAREKLNMPVRSFSTSAHDSSEPASHTGSQVRSASTSTEVVTNYGSSAGKKMHKLAIDYLNDARDKRLAAESKNRGGFNTTSRSFSTAASQPTDTTASNTSNPDVVNYGTAAGKKMQKLAIDYLNDAREKRLAEETKENTGSSVSQESK
jgi:hypothetical protein